MSTTVSLDARDAETISALLIDESQRDHISFDAFFANTMFHEVAYGLGIKNTINGNGTVRAALQDVASSMEESKADILGLYMITELHAAGELGEVDLREAVKKYEIQLMLHALEVAGGSRAEAARRLKLPLRTFWHKLGVLGIAEAVPEGEAGDEPAADQE